MLSRKGFTLIELMVVILIVAILAGVAIPIMRGRIDEAKWTEGKAMMGAIASSIRAYVVRADVDPGAGVIDLTTVPIFLAAGHDLGFRPGDLTGTYFSDADFSIISGSYEPAETGAGLTFVIEAVKGKTISAPAAWYLNQAGVWSESPL